MNEQSTYAAGINEEGGKPLKDKVKAGEKSTNCIFACTIWEFP